MRKFSASDVVPVLALGAVAAIAVGAAIGAVREGEASAQSPAAMRVSVVERGSLEETGAFDVGSSAAPSRAEAHTGVARVDGARYPKGLVMAHPSLPLGGWARITELRSGRNLAARVVERPGPVEPNAMVLSADIARGLGLADDARDFAVLVEPMTGSPRDSRLLAARPAYDADSIATGAIAGAAEPVLDAAATANRVLVFGVFADEAEAAALLRRLDAQGLTDGRFGAGSVELTLMTEGPRWRVALGPIAGWTAGLEARRAAREAGYSLAELSRF